ncbi:hypothetical protein QBC43DRAFT_285989 [Cladorrhinum sp. PSN259]|nr:hypothetical protein QBC43DRAFT_285989 [Cladorrhinum sp. PSN259]
MSQPLDEHIRMVSLWLCRNDDPKQNTRSFRVLGTNRSETTVAFQVLGARRLKSPQGNYNAPPVFIPLEARHMTGSGQPSLHVPHAVNRGVSQHVTNEIDDRDLPPSPHGVDDHYIVDSVHLTSSVYQNLNEDELFLPLANQPRQPESFFVGVYQAIGARLTGRYEDEPETQIADGRRGAQSNQNLTGVRIGRAARRTHGTRNLRNLNTT